MINNKTIEVAGWNGVKKQINEEQYCERWYDHNREIRRLAFDLETQNEVDEILARLATLATKSFKNQLEA